MIFITVLSVHKEYKNIDAAKFICSILVVAIHTLKVESIGSKYYFFAMFISSVAVPFFYACSGFFFFKNLEFDKDLKIKKSRQNINQLIKYERKTIILYSVWSCIFFIEKILNALTEGKQALIDFVKSVPSSIFINGMEVHLWYVICLIYALPILYFLCRHISVKYMFIITFFLYTVCQAAEGYSWIESDLTRFMTEASSIMQYGFSVFSRAIPFLSIGMLWSIKKYRINKYFCMLLTIILFLFQFAEKSILYCYFDSDPGARYFISLYLTVFFLMGTILKFEDDSNENRSKIMLYLRKISSLVYFVHPLVIIFIGRVVATFFAGALFIGRFSYFAAVSWLSVMIAFAIICMSEKIKILKYLM